MKFFYNSFTSARLVGFTLAMSLILLLCQLENLSAKTMPGSFADLVEALSPAVVNITTTTTIKGRESENLIVPRGSPLERFFNQPDGNNRPRQRGTALGSGFIISKDGSITNIRMRGPDKNLEKEAERIISKLPAMTPGKQRGRPVRVPFSIPITFRLQ